MDIDPVCNSSFADVERHLLRILLNRKNYTQEYLAEVQKLVAIRFLRSTGRIVAVLITTNLEQL